MSLDRFNEYLRIAAFGGPAFVFLGLYFRDWCREKLKRYRDSRLSRSA